MVWDLVLAIVGAVLLIVGFLGTVIPVLPGAPLAWAAHFSSYTPVKIVTLVICAVIAVAVSVLDSFFPTLFTKSSGGSKAGMVGSTIGLIVGMFLGPLGIIVGPFVGALIGEMIHDSSDFKRCASAAFGAFKGFIFGTGLKMITCAAFIWIYVVAFIRAR